MNELMKNRRGRIAGSVLSSREGPKPKVQGLRSKLALHKAGFEVVRRLGVAMPEVEEGTAYGSPALKVRGKMFACIAIHRTAEANTLAVRLDFDQRDELIASEPNTYYLTEHYVNYPCVLVRLGRIRQDALRDLLLMGRRFMSSAKKPAGRRGRSRTTGD